MTHAVTHARDTTGKLNDARAVGNSAPSTPTGSGNTRLVRAATALVAGLGLLVVVFANLDRITDWADTHGPVGVYLGFFLVMSLAGRLFWWGADTLVKAAVSQNPEATR